MSDIVRITFDQTDFDRLMAQYDLYRYEVEEDMRDAAEKTTRDVNTIALRWLAQSLGISKKLMQQRIKSGFRFVHSRDNEGAGAKGIVFIGLNPLTLKRLNPKQNKRGVKAGPVTRPGAFIQTTKLGGHVFKRRGKNRLPLDKQSYKIDEAAKVQLETAVYPKVDMLYQANLMTFLKYKKRRR